MKKHHKNGLTLVELLVLIAIIAIAVIGYLYFFTGKESDIEQNAADIEQNAVLFQSPEEVARAYYEVRNWADRLPFVMDAERVEPLMGKRYRVVDFTQFNYETCTYSSNNPANAFLSSFKPNITIVSRTQMLETENLVVKGLKRSFSYYVVNHQGKYLVDWEASMGHNPQTLIEFKTKFPSRKLGRFRLMAQLGNEYYGAYGGNLAQQMFYSIFLGEKSPSKPNVTEGVRGYIAKNTALGKRAFNYLRNGEFCPVVVDIVYPEGSKDHEYDNIVQISNFNEGWSLY